MYSRLLPLHPANYCLHLIFKRQKSDIFGIEKFPFVKVST
ncbi:hypothetical protein SBDP1_360058 [Syntrophobacter sp. SbD1]|nr:hypothetical protein SBDP1_360058 [Syntrophobacter sp. SbD1]